MPEEKSKPSFDTSVLIKRKEPKFGKMKEPFDVWMLLHNLEYDKIDQEAMVVITVNEEQRAIDVHLASLGTKELSAVPPHTIFRYAIADGAPSIFIAHNHIGGLEPSHHDYKLTNRIIAVGRAIDIQVLDHIIISNHDIDKPFRSMKEEEDILFDK